jgi:HKD family nuclease
MQSDWDKHLTTVKTLSRLWRAPKPVQNLLVTIPTTKFNIQKFYVQPAEQNFSAVYGSQNKQ